MDIPITLNSLTFSDEKGNMVVQESYGLIFNNIKTVEIFIQERYKYWKNTLNRKLVLAPDHNETIDELGIRRVFELTAEAYGLKPDAIFSRSRKAPLIEARRFAIAICFEVGQSLTNIKNAVGYSHANVIHHRDKFNELCENEYGYLDKYLGLNEVVLNKLNELKS